MQGSQLVSTVEITQVSRTCVTGDQDCHAILPG
jgi:hypothetical protein